MTENQVTEKTSFFRKIWLKLLLIGLIVEAITLAPGHRDTLSETIWDTVRWTNWRLLFLPTWTWLTWHWVLRKEQVMDWRDIVAIGIGLLWAIGEIYYDR